MIDRAARSAIIGIPEGWEVVDPGVSQAVADLFAQRLVACVAGAYVDGSEHCLPPAVARAVVGITRTNACIIHLPVRADRAPRQTIGIEMLLDAFADRARVVPLLNTSRARTCGEALEMIEYGLPVLSGPLGSLFPNVPLVKLEILDEGLEALDEEVVRCLAELGPDVCARTLPIVSPSPGAVAAVAAHGCPAIRVLTGSIGRRTGILEPQAAGRAIAAAEGLPVILEGGIDSAEDVRLAARLGAAGVLMNSTFRLASDPGARARALRAAADEAWPKPRAGS